MVIKFFKNRSTISGNWLPLWKSKKIKSVIKIFAFLKKFFSKSWYNPSPTFLYNTHKFLANQFDARVIFPEKKSPGKNSKKSENFFKMFPNVPRCPGSHFTPYMGPIYDVWTYHQKLSNSAIFACQTLIDPRKKLTLKSHCNPEGEARGLQLKLVRVTSGDQVPLVTSED